MKKIKERVLSASSPDVLASPIPQWGPSAARAWAPVRRHPRERPNTLVERGQEKVDRSVAEVLRALKKLEDG